MACLTYVSQDDSRSRAFDEVALREQFTMSGEILKLMQSGQSASTQEIEKAAIASGMMTMQQDGVLQVLAGKTTLDEILRVIG